MAYDKYTGLPPIMLRRVSLAHPPAGAIASGRSAAARSVFFESGVGGPSRPGGRFRVGTPCRAAVSGFRVVADTNTHAGGESMFSGALVTGYQLPVSARRRSFSGVAMPVRRARLQCEGAISSAPRAYLAGRLWSGRRKSGEGASTDLLGEFHPGCPLRSPVFSIDLGQEHVRAHTRGLRSVLGAMA